MCTSRTILAVALVTGACAANQKPVATGKTSQTLVTMTAITSAELPPGAGFEPLAPSLSVEKEIAEACKRNFDDASKAPKFQFDDSQLLPADMEALHSLATCLTIGPLRGRQIKLVGRADSRGTERYNQGLGARRTKNVATFLEHYGVAPARVHETSRGELDSDGSDDTSWQSDRRVDIILL